MFNLAPAETKWFIAIVTTNAKVPLNNNLLFIDTSRMLQCYFKRAKNWIAFSFLNANLVFAHSVFWCMLLAESHSGGIESKGLGFQQTIKAPWPSAALPNPTAPVAKGRVQAMCLPGSGWWGLWNRGASEAPQGVAPIEECRSYII